LITGRNGAGPKAAGVARLLDKAGSLAITTGTKRLSFAAMEPIDDTELSGRLGVATRSGGVLSATPA